MLRARAHVVMGIFVCAGGHWNHTTSVLNKQDEAHNMKGKVTKVELKSGRRSSRLLRPDIKLSRQ